MTEHLIPPVWVAETLARAEHSRAVDLTTRAELRNVRETRRVAFDAFELREKANGSGGTDLTFSGFASVTEQTYRMEDWLGPYDEIVRSGAFAKTLGEKPDVMLLLNHEGMPLARTKSGTLDLSEVSTGSPTGLFSEARLAADSARVKEIRTSVDRGDLDEMSFAFRVTRQQWSPEYDQRDILEVNLNQGDVSLVNYGANGHTGGSVSVRSLAAQFGLLDLNEDEMRELATMWKASRAIPDPPAADDGVFVGGDADGLARVAEEPIHRAAAAALWAMQMRDTLNRRTA